MAQAGCRGSPVYTRLCRGRDFRGVAQGATFGHLQRSPHLKTSSRHNLTIPPSCSARRRKTAIVKSSGTRPQITNAVPTLLLPARESEPMPLLSHHSSIPNNSGKTKSDAVSVLLHGLMESELYPPATLYDPGNMPSVPSSRTSESALRLLPPSGGQMPSLKPCRHFAAFQSMPTHRPGWSHGLMAFKGKPAVKSRIPSS